MSDADAPLDTPLVFWTPGAPSVGKPITGGDIVTFVLTDAHRASSIAELLDRVSWRLVGEGVPLSRSTFHIRTLHPQLTGIGARWRSNPALVEESQVLHGALADRIYLDSPIRPVAERGEVGRFQLERDDVSQVPVLVALRDAGVTEYLALPLTFSTGRHQVVTFATERPGGFSVEDIGVIDRILPALAVTVEAQATRRLMGNVLDTYLGRTIGRHILNGEIQRRQGEEIRAALLATDLRGFTTLSDRLPSADLIDLLDDYFDAVAMPIAARGGEVLKFVGDGLLAIFATGAGEAAATGAALAAAEEALARLDALNGRRHDLGQAPIRIGIGLHVGSVVYGNVGAVDRLDFTAIGPAVNLVCRLESLTKRLERPLLVSHDFAATCGRPLVSLGFHPVRGLSAPEEVFGLT